VQAAAEVSLPRALAAVAAGSVITGRAAAVAEPTHESLMTAVQVLLERDLVAGPPNCMEYGGATCPVSLRSVARRFVIEKYKTLNDLSLVIEQEIGIPRNRQAFVVRIQVDFVKFAINILSDLFDVIFPFSRSAWLFVRTIKASALTCLCH
jgi:hypothetical protein